MKFTNREIADYYNSTQNHYENWWKLKEVHALHYGMWDKNTKNFAASLLNTNRTLMNIAQVSSSDKVLDAGCGVGGTSFFLNKTKGAEVIGISLSEKQITTAKEAASKLKNSDKLNFHLMDYCNTTFENESFDVVWACESMCHTENKSDFLEECFRILKHGGRLIISDYFLTPKKKDSKSWIDRWLNTWGVPNITSEKNFVKSARASGFNKIDTFDFTEKIQKSAKRMYLFSLLGTVPSELYNIFHPNVSRFAKKHYQSGYYQYKALQNNLWKYKVVLAVKP